MLKSTNKHRLVPQFYGVVTVFLAFLVSCQTTPETHRRQLILIDQGSEQRMGADAYRDIIKKSTISNDKALFAKVKKVGYEIASVANVSRFKWEFALIESDVPNAYCFPGGKVGIHTAIIPFAKNEAGLAAVIGHEVGHAVARHGAERMSHAMLMGVFGKLLAQGIGETDANRELLRVGYGIGSAVAITLPFSRSHELEADRLGLIYMARAGYDPSEAILFWKRFSEAKDKKGSPSFEFLSTHPADRRRIAQLKKFLPEAMEVYERAQIKRGKGSPLL